MIVKTLCATCSQDYEILLETGDINLLRPYMNMSFAVPCPSGCGGHISLAGATRQEKPVIGLTGKTLHETLEELSA